MLAVEQSNHLEAKLLRGTISVEVQRSEILPKSLFEFGERKNPKRAFLFVSRILGKHIPARPFAMASSYQLLASKVPYDMPGPVLVIGMAETAVGLGAGFHREFLKRRPDSVFLTSTRHPVDGDLFCRFEEEHSHASAHLVYYPVDQLSREMMLSARSIVVVDDEMSTGTTVKNLVESLVSSGLSKLERVVAVTLTDWSQGAIHKQLSLPCESISLLSGCYSFETNPDAPMPEMPSVETVEPGTWSLSESQDWGRLGATSHEDTLGRDVIVQPGQNILVIGTGEYVWKPFLLAERLQNQGALVRFGSTTRSPIAIGHGIKCALAFNDNYGLGIPNFLYNVRPEEYDRILLCTETPRSAVDPALIEALGAEVIEG